MKPLYKILLENNASKYSDEQIRQLFEFLKKHMVDPVQQTLDAKIDSISITTMISDLMHSDNADIPNLSKMMTEVNEVYEKLDDLENQMRKALPKLKNIKASNNDGLEKQIAQEIFKLADNQIKKRVRIADLAKAMPNIKKDELDKTLAKMQQEGGLALYRLDDTSSITPDDKKHAIYFGGNPRHIIYLEEPPSKF